MGGDNCHRGALLGALLGAAGLPLSEGFREGLHDPDGKTAAATERYLAVVKQGGGRSETVVLALAPKPAEAVSSAASECKT